jgi:hypothetical protein
MAIFSHIHFNYAIIIDELNEKSINSSKINCLHGYNDYKTLIKMFTNKFNSLACGYLQSI